jgi:PAS domain S-box-containing protein
MFGYTPQEMIGELIYKLIPPERKGEEDMILSKLTQGQRIENFETLRLTKSGRQIEVSLTISPIRNSEGVIIGASKIARDISQDRQQAKRLELLLGISKHLSSDLDIDSLIQKVTDTTTSISGASFGAFFYNKTDAKGESYMLYGLSGAPREAFDKFGMPRNTAVFQHTFNGIGIVRSDDITQDPRYGKNYPHKGMPAGHLPVVSYLAIPVISGSGVVIGGLFFGHPKKGMFTEEHEKIVSAVASQAAIALDNAKLYHDINQVNKNKDQFIGFASHELKTPLTTARGYVQLALKKSIPAEEAFEKISKQLLRFEKIIGDLLDISKIQAGRMALNFNHTSLHSIIRESIESVDLRSHKMEVEKPEEDTQVFVDHQKLSQVIVNILTNAVKYSPQNTVITLSATIIGDEVLICIEDQGIGISQQHLEKIFDQYYRVPQNESKRGTGMGIGLFISKEIIEGHLGKIWAESSPGKGSSFSILFPVSRPRLHDH